MKAIILYPKAWFKLSKKRVSVKNNTFWDGKKPVSTSGHNSTSHCLGAIIFLVLTSISYDIFVVKFQFLSNTGYSLSTPLSHPSSSINICTDTEFQPNHSQNNNLYFISSAKHHMEDPSFVFGVIGNTQQHSTHFRCSCDTLGLCPQKGVSSMTFLFFVWCR